MSDTTPAVSVPSPNVSMQKPLALFTPKGPKRYPHQRRGLRKMITTKGVFALLFDPGAGKTLPTLDYFSLLALKAMPDDAGVREVRVLVTGPLAAVDTWVDQAEKYVTDDVQLWAEALGGSVRQRAEALAARGGRPFAKESRTRKKHGPRGIHFEKSILLSYRSDRPMPSPADGPDMLGTERPRLIIEVVNLETFSIRSPVSKSASTTLADVMLDAVKRFNPDIVVVDESHKIKSFDSNVSRMLRRIGRVVPRRGILTGTVMPVGPLDVWGQWAFLRPEAFGDLQPDGTRKPSNYASFVDKYATMGGFQGKNVVGFKNLDELQRIMAENAEVAKKSDVLSLPKTKKVKVRVDLSSVEQKAYTEMKKGLATKLSSGISASAANRLSLMMRLRQITSGFVPDDVGNMNVLGDSKARTVDSVVNDTLAGEKRVVVFALFLYEIAELKRKLARQGTEMMIITGQTDKQERLRMRLRFGDLKGNPNRIVMVAQIKTMSLSVNELVSAQHAVYASLPQDRADFVQSMDRLDRIGQTLPVTFWFALVPGSIDEVIYNAHLTRTSLEEAVLRHIFATAPDEEDAAALELRRGQDEQDQVGRLHVREDGVMVRYYNGQESELPPGDPRNDADAIQRRLDERQRYGALA